ncbi:hypothetical protein [Legionella sp.]|uniref:hypothetical protein n=1 Tax=Legionella sp. TaxID=459 RepID=UPI000CB991C2|nr:hypothetical protein [Legionella sp.]PJE09084.1 MAG: hypothetical protein CK430_11415 [Legionella sp.]
MLTDEQAKALWIAISQMQFSSPQDIVAADLTKLRADTVEPWLKNWRESHLANKYGIALLNEKPIRVCEKKGSSVADVTARGIDMARAAAEILRLSQKENVPLVEVIKVYLRQMQQIATIAQAVQETNDFHGALVNLLEKKVFQKRKPHQIFEALCFVRDFLWQRDFVREHCVVERLNQDEFFIRYVQPLTFSAETTTKSPWENLHEQKWLIDLRTEFAQEPWFDEFIEQHGLTWSRLSSTPMTRLAPNPANAAAITDIYVKEDEISVFGQHLRAAITEPLDVPNAQARQAITNWNHSELIIPQMREQLAYFMSIWGDFYQEGPIPFTILHQTLIGDEVSFTPDQQKARATKLGGSVIDSKYKANRKLSHNFADEAFYFHPSRGELKKIAGPEPIPPDFLRVNIKLLETNHCINMWQNRARVRNHDISHSRALINQSVSIYQQVASRYPNDDLNILVDFLTSADHAWFTPYKSRGPQVKAALEKLSRALIEGSYPFYTLPGKTRRHLTLGLQAAVELKCMVHETWAGSARRHISNWSRNHLREWYFLGFGHLVDWGIRGILTVAAQLVKLPFIIPHFIYLSRHWYDRENIFLSAYEGLLAESMGMLTGGCMSAVDRYGEIAEFRAALKKQLISEGQIVSFNDNHEKKLAFREKYGSTVAKHNLAENSTGTAGTKEPEIEGYIVDNLILKTEDEEERNLFKLLAVLRVGKYNKSMDYEKYFQKRSTSLSHEIAGSTPFPIVVSEPVLIEPSENACKSGSLKYY